MQPPTQNLRGYRFGPFELDLRTGEIRRNGLKVKLQEQPFQVLTILVQSSPDLVAREDLRKRLWGADTFVDFDHSLNNAISRIREALGDSADHERFIETLPKRGYRFIAPVEELVSAHPTLAPRAKGNGALPGDPPPETQRQELTSIGETNRAPRRMRLRIPVLGTLAVAVAVLFLARTGRHATPKAAEFTQITNFSDEAFAPAISPDGRMLAFIRGNDVGFPTVGEIYTKLLPDGEPVQRTHDGWPKYGVTFSPDGLQIAYTVATNQGWNTAIMPVLGGESRILLSNAAGLTWLDGEHVLFSEIKTGLHMGLVTATVTRSELRDIYLPEHQRGMAHYSYLSPDRKMILVVEMGPTGAWARCRLVPFDGSSSGAEVGPSGACRSAAWSPDGKWMYFSAIVNGSSHLWRQPFPNGEPEQLTFGPTEEAGVAISRDGRSIVSAVGINDSGVWLHDALGEHPVYSEGYASMPSFSRDGRIAYYLLRRESPQSPRELWMTVLASGKSEPVVQGFVVTGYDISPDGKQAVFSTRPAEGPSQLWLASCDHAFAPRMLASSGEDSPFFGPDDDVLFRMSEGGKNFIFQMKLDATGRRKVMPGAIINFAGMSPDRRWAVATVPVDEIPTTAVVAAPVEGGTPKRICPAICMAKWSPDGTRFYVEELLQGTESGMTIAMSLPKGKSLPDLPPDGIESARDATGLPGSRLIDLSTLDPTHVGVNVAPGPGETFIYARSIVHRNLFQIHVP
jgi:DNA-binding winged helix-turn-helix (wHTH) protein/Tol biopolymer transport system component